MGLRWPLLPNRVPIPPNTPVLSKPPARYYTSTLACSCPDYTYRRKQKGQNCKHMALLRRVNGLARG